MKINKNVISVVWIFYNETKQKFYYKMKLIIFFFSCYPSSLLLHNFGYDFPPQRHQ